MGELTWKGAATGVIYGFLQSVIHLQERFDTDRVAFCFDSRFSKRQKLYPAYKANRKHRQPMTDKEREFEAEFHRQIIKLRMEYLPAIGFRNILWQQGYEADDLIASAANTCIEQGDEAVIVTADEDLFQCIRGCVSTFNPLKQERMTLQKFWERYKIRPENWPFVKAVAGCSSDNIPGLKGIGQVKALHYLWGVLPKGSKDDNQILGAQETGEPLDTYMKLVTLPFPGTKTVHLHSDNRISKESWNDVCKHLGFKTLHPRIPKYGNQR
jgi:DNA polymerase-1